MTPEVFAAMGRRAYKDMEKRLLEGTDYATIEEYKQDSEIGEISRYSKRSCSRYATSMSI